MLAAALHAFAVHGYSGVSVRTLNKELGVSHNLLHQRFGSKQAVWYAAVDWGFGGLVDVLVAGDDPAKDPLDRLHGFVRAFVAFSGRNTDLFRLVSIEAAESTERLEYIARTYVEPVAAWFSPVVDELVAAGRVRPVPAELLHYMITSGGGAMFGNAGMTRYLFGDGPLDPDRIDYYANEVADFIIGGMLPPRRA